MRESKESKWYVAYTRSRFEKKVHLRIKQLGIESFLPLSKMKRQWSDRIKFVEVPLFSSYVFVRTSTDRIPKLMRLTGISRFLSFNGKLATVKDEEIRLIEKVLKNDNTINIDVQPQKFRKKQRMRILHGIFKGLEGVLLKKHSEDCFVFSIDGLNQDLLITVPSNYLETMPV